MPSKERVRIVHDFELPVERVFAFLAEHENLSKVFAPAKISRLRDGTDGTRNGVGSVRRLRIGLLPPIEETVTSLVTNELIEYTITRGSPLKGHLGRMEFQPRGKGSRLTYTIGFEAPVPGLARFVGRVLQSKMKKGLGKVERFA